METLFAKKSRQTLCFKIQRYSTLKTELNTYKRIFYITYRIDEVRKKAI